MDREIYRIIVEGDRISSYDQYKVSNTFGKNVQIFENVCIGFPSSRELGEVQYEGCEIGDNAVIRSGTVIYAGVSIGSNFTCGHNVLIREATTICDGVLVGSGSIIDGDCYIGRDTRIQSGVYIPRGCYVGDCVFIGPRVCFTNDKYPPSNNLKGITVEDYVVVGANTTILPGVKIGKNSVVGAGSVVTNDVEPNCVVYGNPSRTMRRVNS